MQLSFWDQFDACVLTVLGSCVELLYAVTRRSIATDNFQNNDHDSTNNNESRL